MKEFQSTTGGRHVYNTDFKNLQELALAMQELFKACGGNFVISGCNVTTSTTTSVSEGYVYIDGKVRQVSAASGLSTSNLYIVANQRSGDSIPYADGNNGNQYIEYYAEVKNTSSVSGAYIAYDSSTASFPNLATVFFNYYAVCKKAGAQSVDNLTVSKSFVALNGLLASQGVALDSTGAGVYKSGDSIILKVGQYLLAFNSSGVISVKNGSALVFSFSNGSGSGTITYENIKVTQNINTNKLYLDDVDIEDKLVPLGVIQMWAGSVDNIPNNYLLCNGQAVSQTDYPALYKAIGNTFNTAPNANGVNWAAPSTGMFRLPDLQGRFVVGYNPSNNDYKLIANAGGEASHKLQTNELPQHNHSVDDYYGTENSGKIEEAKKGGNLYGSTISLNKYYLGWNASDWDNNRLLYATHTTENTGSGDAHENRPPYYVLAYIMRAK